MSSAAQRSLKYLRSHGYQVALVELAMRVRQDLFGFADRLAGARFYE
jgi:hypothetical protein